MVKFNEDWTTVSSGRDFTYCTNTRAETYTQNEKNGFSCEQLVHVRYGSLDSFQTYNG